MRKLVLVLLVLSMIIAGLGIAKDTVVINLQAEPSRLNPIIYQDTETSMVLESIYAPLLDLTEDGDFTTEGAVTERFTISDDGLVYTFYIKQGIKFHNGDPLTARDVKFSYESFMDPDLGSPHNRYYAGIEEIVLVDDYTLEIHLKELDIAFLTLARLRGAVMPKDYIESIGWDEYERHPIGAGPYEFVRRVPAQSIELRRFEDYFGDNAKIANVVFRYYPEMSTAIMAIRAGQVDFIGELPTDEFNALKRTAGADLNFGTYERFEDHRVVFNKRPGEPFADVLVRQAVNYAIDRSEIIALTRPGMATPAVGRVPTFHPAHAADAPAYEVDLDKARELLTEAGYPDGFKTKIFAPSNHRERVLEAQQIQRQLARIGIEAEVVAVEWGTYLDVTADGEAPMFRERWSASAPEPISFIESWHSESSWNPIFGTYYNEEVDRLVDLIRVTIDTEERWELYREVQRIAMEDAVCVPLYYPLVGEAYSKDLYIPEDLWNPFKRPISAVHRWEWR